MPNFTVQETKDVLCLLCVGENPAAAVPCTHLQYGRPQPLHHSKLSCLRELLRLQLLQQCGQLLHHRPVVQLNLLLLAAELLQLQLHVADVCQANAPQMQQQTLPHQASILQACSILVKYGRAGRVRMSSL